MKTIMTFLLLVLVLLPFLRPEANLCTDHTREYIPLLAYSPSFTGNGLIPVGHFADISATVADNFGVDTAMIGESFLQDLV
ncbi:hypothetical protein SAG0066_03185 [Streptococcus agalactiae CCUG 38383]|nr:hypothetical protein SAG0066_03185 [Streptococcus agalactiae CCUG 38383]